MAVVNELSITDLSQQLQFINQIAIVEITWKLQKQK